MKKNYRKNVFRTIKSTLSRFLAIFAIVALGVGFLAGLLSAPNDMRLSVDDYFDSTDMYDLRIVSTLGLTDADLEKVRQTEGVESVLPVHDTDMVFLSADGDSYTTRVHTLPTMGTTVMNTTILQSGRMPEKAGECVIAQTPSLVETKDWLGETLIADSDDETGSIPEKLTVVGTVKSAAYISMEQEYTTVGSGTVGLIAYTVDGSFDLDYYTGFYLTLRGAKHLNSFSEDYDNLLAPVKETLESLGKVRAQIRYEEIVEEANSQLADAKQEYKDGKCEADEKLNDAEKELTDGEKKLAESKQQLDSAKAEIDNGQAELNTTRETALSQLDSAQNQIDDGYAQLAGHQSQLDSAQKQIDDAQTQLNNAYAKIDENQQQLTATKAKLDETETSLTALKTGKESLWQLAAQIGLSYADTTDNSAIELIERLESFSPETAAHFLPLKTGLQALAAQGIDLDTAFAQLESGKAEYEQAKTALETAKAELDEKQAELTQQSNTLAKKQVQLDTQKAELDANAATLQQTRAETLMQFGSAQAKLDSANDQYEEGLAEWQNGEKELTDARIEFEKNKAEVEAELTDAEEKIKDAESDIREIETGQWYIFTRDDNTGYSSYDSNADKIAAIATVFPIFFFLVAALVALTTMTRMVEEERQQIGTMKALGYSSAQIAAKYLIYAAIAGVAGCVFGLAVGLRLFPYIIINAYNIMYDLPKALTPFNAPYALFSSAAAVACTMLATVSACRNELKEAPASLMLPKAPKIGKRVFLEYITPLWRRMKFTQKVTARNLLRYKKRFFMTIVGIAGCTALLVTGFGVKDSVSNIVSNQYGELNQYQLIVAMKDESALDGRDFKNILNNPDLITDSTAVMQENGKIVPNGNTPDDTVIIFAPSDVTAFSEYFTFRHRTDSEPVTFNENAVIITEKLAERQKIKIGDTVTVKNSDEKTARFTVTDICENYVAHYLYISPATYQSAFGEPSACNAVLCKLPENTDSDSLATKLLKCRDISAAQFTDALSESFAQSIESINSIIVVLIVCAGLLAFVVLYNLTNINISERVKEIATIKVLGFYDGEVSAYIYRENIVLTILGTAIGLVLGVFLHQFVMRTAEVDMVMFGRSVYPLSFVWSALLTVVFSALVNAVMHRKLKKISMVESMKAPE